MKPESLEQLRVQIEAAHALVSAGHFEVAVHLFAAAREFATREVDQTKLDAEISRQIGLHYKEREAYRRDISAIYAEMENPRPLVLVSDSLGLPRPESKDTPRKGAEHLYVDLLGAAGRRVDPICQRYFTVEDAVSLFEENATLGQNSDVVIHLGLNDTARRMFLERQRIAMQFVPAEVRGKVVGFAQKYRAHILKWLPPLHYTPPERFSASLERVCSILKSRNAHRIVLTTIILPPQRFWC